MQHDPAHVPGSDPPCPGCGPDAYDLTRPRHEYIVIAGHGAAMSVCGHYHAEHVTDDYATAVQLVTDLRRAGHDTIELYRWAPERPDYMVGSAADPWRPRHIAVTATSGSPNGHCAPCATPYDRGTSCGICGDPMTHWTPRALVTA